MNENDNIDQIGDLIKIKWQNDLEFSDLVTTQTLKKLKQSSHEDAPKYFKLLVELLNTEDDLQDTRFEQIFGFPQPSNLR